MKNVFKKTVALVSAMSLLAAASVMSVSASETEIDLVVLTKSAETGDFVADATAKAGETVEIMIATVDSTNFKLDTISLRNEFTNGADNKSEGKLKYISKDNNATFKQV